MATTDAVVRSEDELATDTDPRVKWRPSVAGYAGRFTVLAIILGFVLAVPHLIPGVLVNQASKAMVYAVIALSMNVLIGYAGQVSFGHAAFLGVGAFTAAIVLSDSGLPYPAAVVASILTGAVSAAILGGIALRVRGLYLAIVTIAYGIFAQEVVFNIRSLTGGGAGKLAPRPGFASGDIAYVYFCLAALLLVWAFDWRLTASKAGRAIEALRDDERVAASWGINVTGYKLLAFIISGSIAGLAGILFAGIEQIVTPTSFRFDVSLTFVLMTVVGGVGSRPGVVMGGIVFAVLGTVLDQFHENFTWWPFTSLWEPLIGAALLLLTLIFFPGGIAQQNEHLFRWLSFKPFRGEKSVTVGGGTAGGGGASARP